MKALVMAFLKHRKVHNTHMHATTNAPMAKESVMLFSSDQNHKETKNLTWTQNAAGFPLKHPMLSVYPLEPR